MKISSQIADVQPLPATLRIATEPPEFGWWNWVIAFEQAQYIDGAICAMPPSSYSEQPIVHTIQCSDVFDPIPYLHVFIETIKKTHDAEWVVDEEGQLLTIKVMYCNWRIVHLRIFSSFYDTDYCHDFFLDRDECIKTLQTAYHSFGKAGGWGNYGDYACEED